MEHSHLVRKKWKGVTHSFSEGLHNKMYHVYLLKLNSKEIYTGLTPDISRRIKEHQTGMCLSTKNFRPVKLIWFCTFTNRLVARRFEKYLKSGSGQSFRNRHFIN
jgi:putative endonuclease